MDNFKVLRNIQLSSPDDYHFSHVHVTRKPYIDIKLDSTYNVQMTVVGLATTFLFQYSARLNNLQLPFACDPYTRLM